MSKALLVMCVFLCSMAGAVAQVSVGIGLPGVSIGIDVASYPQLVRVPGYPVYYASSLPVNYFFYDGMYWVFDGDNWYASAWYNGPWQLVRPDAVPLYLLRVPVRYYRHVPDYFHGWRVDAPPRWGEHWGGDWERRHSGWDKWDRRAAPAPAPLPTYQRQFSGNRYPHEDQQRLLQNRNYRYQPREAVVREHWQGQRAEDRSAPRQGRQPASRDSRASQPMERRSQTPSAGQEGMRQAPAEQSRQMRGRDVPRSVGSAPEQQPGRAVERQRERGQQMGGGREQQPPRQRGEDAGARGKNPDREAGQQGGAR